MDSRKPTILILCTANSCRSQMAEGLFRHYGGDRYDVHSAGTDPAEIVHPLAVQAMAEHGIDIAEQQPKDVGVYLGRLSVRTLFVVCREAEKKCPRIFPGMLSRVIWPINDPVESSRSEEESLNRFREVRDELETRIKEWISENA